MLEVTQLDFSTADTVAIEIEVHEPEEDVEYSPEEFILMQYTGLKDKNGKEIYEGDIVRVRPSEFDTELVLWKMIFKHGMFIAQDPEDDFREWWPTDEHGDIEVAGNIYENPELLTSNEERKSL